MSEPTTVHARLRRGICDDRCHVKDARSGCDCAEAADLIDALVEALETAEAFIMIAVPYYARDRKEAVEILPGIRAALARAKGEPK